MLRVSPYLNLHPTLVRLCTSVSSKACKITSANQHGPFPPAVILVRPMLSENVGATARAMLNCGLTDLRVVAPICDWRNKSARSLAVGADHLLDDGHEFRTVAAAVADLHITVATTGRATGSESALSDRGVLSMTDAMTTLVKQHSDIRCGVMFGTERSGLTPADVQHADLLCCVPLNPNFMSLNLSQAVLLMAWEWLRVARLVSTQDDYFPLLAVQTQSIVPDWNNTSHIKSQDENVGDGIRKFQERLTTLLVRPGQSEAIAKRRQRLVHQMTGFLGRVHVSVGDIRTLHAIVAELTRSDRGSA